MVSKVILAFLIVASLTAAVSPAKILFAVAFPGKSHWMMFEPVINEILKKGHEVTAITNFQLKTTSPKYREIIIEPGWDWEAALNMTEFFNVGGKTESIFFKIHSLWYFGIETTKVALNSPVVKNFIETDRTQFDLVISEQFQQEAFNMFAVKYNCPLITISTLDIANFMDRSRGALTPLSHVPHHLSYSSDKMSFFERAQNTAAALFDAIGRKFYYLPKQTELAREAFVSLENQRGGRLPSAEDLEKKIVLHLVNSHPALSFPRPRMPGMVDIAGIQILPPKPLPTDIQKFLDDAIDGAIYVSFGSFLKSSEMPPEKYKAMIDVFGKLKQRVLWKWESNDVPNLPANVMVKKWLPQSDVLAHKKIDLFICHGGVFGMQEAIFNAVPMIIFPFFGDQHLNGHKMQQRGIAVMEAMNELTANSLMSSIKTIINNHTYYENVRLLSQIFRTNQNDPLSTAVYWIEYIIKFKGAPHLQSPAKNLSWFRYLQLDMVFLVLGVIYTIYDLIKDKFDKKTESKPEAKKEDASKKKSKNKKKEN